MTTVTRTISVPSLQIAGALCLALLLSTGCASQGSKLPPLPPAPAIEDSYVLGPGDRLQIVYFGSATGAGVGDQTGETTIGASGLVGAPLIGQVQASGRTLDQLKHDITNKLADGYLTKPNVGIEIMTYRPFYVIGEVVHPGAYPYTAHANVLSAIATAGGYTYRAEETFAVIDRKDNGAEISGRAALMTPVLPGDVIRISQRYY